MNVEQLIDTALTANREVYSPREEEIFALGVRHTIAVMFPVVKVEDVQFPNTYVGFDKVLKKWKTINTAWDCKDGESFSYCGLNVAMNPDDYSEIRQVVCPTPGDVGMGGGNQNEP